MDIRYEVKTNKPFEEAVESLKASLKQKTFGVLWELNFKDKLKENGIDFGTNFKIFEVCNPKQASEVLSRNIEVGYFLPCKLVVYEKNGATYIGMMKPLELIKMMGEDELADIAENVENTLISVIDDAV